MASSPFCLVEDAIPHLIKNLQERQMKIIILTASPVGRIDQIPSIEDWRDIELKRLGIDISDSFSNHSPTVFNLLNRERGLYPLFKNGILLTNGDSNTKGNVLKAFLNLLDWKPSKIIFVDDRMTYLNSVEATLSDLGIHHLGIHYKGSDHVPVTHLSEETIKSAWQEIVDKTKLVARKEASEF